MSQKNEVVVDAKGDILVGKENNLTARLGVGEDGAVLTADSSAQLGVAWSNGTSSAVIDSVSVPGYGVEVVPSELMTANFDMLSQRIYWVRFTVSRGITVNGAAFAGDSVAAAATPTLARLGLYAVEDDGAGLWALARSTADTSLFDTTMTVEERTFDTSWAESVTLLPGRGYATAAVIDTEATVPKLTASPSPRTSLQSFASMRTLRSGVATDLVGSWTAAMAFSANTPWSKCLVGGDDNMARTAVLLGDSFFASYHEWFGLGNAQGGARLHPRAEKGAGSETLADMLDRWDADVAPYDPEWVVLHGGGNDIFAEGATSATVIARYESAIAAAQADGASLLICTPPSNTDASAGQKTTLGEVRTWLLALNTSGAKVADTGMALTTGDGVTADGSLLVDTVHPNGAGKQAMADVLDDVIATIA